MPDLITQWTALFHRAAKSEIGIRITLDTEVTSALIDNIVHQARPPGFQDYSAAIGSLPNTIFIVKPGVTLD